MQAAGTTKWSNLIRNMGGLSLSMEGSEVWKDSLQKKFDHLRVAGKIIMVMKTCWAHMLQNV